MIYETRATSGLRSEEIGCAESAADVIVTAIGESDPEEIEIGVSRDTLGAGPASRGAGWRSSFLKYTADNL